MRRRKKTISRKAALGGLVSAVLICSLFIMIGYLENKHEAEKAAEVAAVKPHVDYFAGLKLEAKSAVVYDVKNKSIIFEKDAATTRPLASITKVMTALVADESLSKNQTVAIDQSSLDVEGESGFKVNQPWKFSDLLNFTLLVSSNDGAHAIANAVSALNGESFPSEMNAKAKALGLNSMRFNNESGLDVDSSVSGGYGSAEDVAKLFSYVLTKDPGLLEITKNDSWNFRALDNTLYPAENTDLIVNKVPGLLASKTGFTDLAGGNLAIAFDSGLDHPIVIVVLGSSWDGRFTDVMALASSTRKTLDQ